MRGRAPLVETDDDGLDLVQYWRMVRKHWLSIVMLGFAGFLAAQWNAGTQVPMYSASVTIVVDPSRGADASVGSNYSYYYAAQMFYETQQTVLASRELAERAAERLSPTEKSRLTRVVEPGWVDRSIAAVRQALTGLFSTPSEPQSPAGGAGSESTLTVHGGRIQGGTSISSARDSSQILTVRFASHDREMAARVANVVADTYIDYTAQTRESLSQQSGRWLAQQVERMREKLTESQNALQKFQMREGLVNLEDVRELASARLQSLNEKVAEAQRTYDDFSKRYGPRHPSLIRARTELESARAQLNAESQSIVLDADKRFQLAKLENDVKSNQEVYELYLSRFRQLDVTGSEAVLPVYVLDRAQPPGAPYQPNKQRIGTLGFMGGLFLGALLAWLREKLDNTIHTTGQMEQELGIPTIGAVPLISRDESRQGRRMAKKRRDKPRFSLERFYVHHSKSPFAESINHIRTGILYSNAEKVPKTVLITSAVQSEGKTTFSINLALALAQFGSTLLIDADLRKPRVHQITRDKNNAGGLVELLVGRITKEEAVIEDEGTPALKILKSGVIPPNPQEILASRKFQDLLQQFESEYDHIVVDCAPVVPVSDALVVSSKVDAVLLLVEANATPIEMVKDAVRRLTDVNAPLTGAVLSLFDPRRGGHFGRYSYYSKYYTYAYGRKG